MSNSVHAQASFFCKDTRYSIPDSPFSIPTNITRVELNELVNQIAYPSSNQDSHSSHEFDFLIQGQLIRGTLEDHIAENQLLTEEALLIECVERNPPPAVTQEVDHHDWVSAIHCNEELILTGCYDGSVRVWTNQGELVCIANGHSGPVKAVQWVTKAGSTEYLFLSGSQDQTVHLWRLTLDRCSHDDLNEDMSTPSLKGHVTLVHQCKGHGRSVEAIDVNSDESKFCSVSWDGFIKIWSAVPDHEYDSTNDDMEQESNLPSKKFKMESSSSDRRTTTRTPLATFKGHSKAVTTVVWVEQHAAGGGDERGAGLSDDIITGGWDNCIRVWDVETGVNKNTLTGTKAFNIIDWSSQNSLIASGSSDKLVRLWDARQSESSLVHSSLSSHTGWVVGVAWSPSNSNQLLSGSHDATLRLWDIRSNKKPLYTIVAHQGKVLCADWSRPKMFASGGTDNKLRTFSV